MKTKFFIILFCLFSLLVTAENRYVHKGDSLFRLTHYDDALRQYTTAESADHVNVKDKKQAIEKCRDLERQIQYTSDLESKLELYNRLIEINPSSVYKKKRTEIQTEIKRIRIEKQKAEERERILQEQERKRQEQDRKNKEDDNFWSSCVKTNTIDSYRTYLDKYPSGRHVSEATNKIATIEDERNWKEACQVNSIDAYTQYLNNGGKKVTEAYKKLDTLYYRIAASDDSVESYDEYIKRSYQNGASKEYLSAALKRKDALVKQTKLIEEADRAPSNESAYNKIQMARSYGNLNASMRPKAMRLAEPYAYTLATSKQSSIAQASGYLQDYRSVAPQEHIDKVTKRLKKLQRKEDRKDKLESIKYSTHVTHKTKKKSSTSYTYTKPARAIRTSSISVAKPDFTPYYNQNGIVQYTWFGVEGFMGTSFGGAASIFEWRFGPVELSPLVFGYNYVPDFMYRNYEPKLPHSVEDVYYQPTVRFYFPVRGSEWQALTFAGAPIIRLDSDPWFMAEVGYNLNFGRWNMNVFARYNGDYQIGFQVKLCHVFGR